VHLDLTSTLRRRHDGTDANRARFANVKFYTREAPRKPLIRPKNGVKFGRLSPTGFAVYSR